MARAGDWRVAPSPTADAKAGDGQSSQRAQSDSDNSVMLGYGDETSLIARAASSACRPRTRWTCFVGWIAGAARTSGGADEGGAEPTVFLQLRAVSHLQSPHGSLLLWKYAFVNCV